MSESALSWAMVVFWRSRIFSTSFSSRRAGAPARIASLRFSSLPTSAVPNSLRMSWKRRLKGSRSVLLTRSFWTVVLFLAAGIGSARGSSLLPGWQSMKYSAIRDCGSEEQLASDLSSGNSGPISKLTKAVFSGVISRSVTVPPVTPEIRTSEPSTSPKALKSSA